MNYHDRLYEEGGSVQVHTAGSCREAVENLHKLMIYLQVDMVEAIELRLQYDDAVSDSCRDSWCPEEPVSEECWVSAADILLAESLSTWDLEDWLLTPESCLDRPDEWLDGCLSNCCLSQYLLDLSLWTWREEA